VDVTGCRDMQIVFQALMRHLIRSRLLLAKRLKTWHRQRQRAQRARASVMAQKSGLRD